MFLHHGKKQSGFQSGPETAPLAAVNARYCQFVGQFTAKTDTQLDMFKKKSFTKCFLILPKNFIYSIKFRCC